MSPNRKLLLQIKLVLFVFLFLSASCTLKKSVDEGCYFENFDNLKMWDRGVIVTDEISHSGSYCTYTDSTHEFSQTFEMDFLYAKSKGYKSINVSAWCFKVTDECKAGFIVSIENPLKDPIIKSYDLAHALEVKNTWINLFVKMDLPDVLPVGSKIKVYCWAPKGEKIFMDDVEIQFVK
jgi:hypothetical protein